MSNELSSKLITALLVVGIALLVIFVVNSFADNRNDAEVEFTRDSLIAINDSLIGDSDSVNATNALLTQENDSLEKAKEITNKTLDSLKIVTEELQAETNTARFQLDKAKTSEDSLRAAIILVVRQDKEIIACGLTVESCMANGRRLQQMVNNEQAKVATVTTDRDKWQKQSADNLLKLDEAIKKLECTIILGIKCPSRNAVAAGGIVLGLVGGYFVFSGGDDVIIVNSPPMEDPDYAKIN